MRRHPALVALSHDHHHALEIALRLRRCDEVTVTEARDALQRFWLERGREHFDDEEWVVLPALARDDPEWGPAVERVLRDHATIRDGIDALGTVPVGERVAQARALGKLLYDHVRFEEREAFAILERRLAGEQLAVLGAALGSGTAPGA